MHSNFKKNISRVSRHYLHHSVSMGSTFKASRQIQYFEVNHSYCIVFNDAGIYFPTAMIMIMIMIIYFVHSIQLLGAIAHRI
jgi:hypothetical protein